MFAGKTDPTLLQIPIYQVQRFKVLVFAETCPWIILKDIHPIGHFQITPGIPLKASSGAHPPIWKPVFICMGMKANSHMKRWAPGPAPKKRPKVIRKWPVNFLLIASESFFFSIVFVIRFCIFVALSCVTFLLNKPSLYQHNLAMRVRVSKVGLFRVCFFIEFFCNPTVTQNDFVCFRRMQGCPNYWCKTSELKCATQPGNQNDSRNVKSICFVKTFSSITCWDKMPFFFQCAKVSIGFVSVPWEHSYCNYNATIMLFSQVLSSPRRLEERPWEQGLVVGPILHESVGVDATALATLIITATTYVIGWTMLFNTFRGKTKRESNCQALKN